MGFGTPRPCPLLTQTEDLHVASGMGWDSHPLHPSLYSQSIPGCQPTSGAPYPQAPASMCVPRSPRVNWLWYSCSPLLQALIVGYAFHFPHLLNPQIRCSAHRALSQKHVLHLVLRGPALCFAAAIFSLFFFPMVSIRTPLGMA
jgi:hypothetical protein